MTTRMRTASFVSQPFSGGRQRGVALLVALMILVIISLIGVAAMRTSLFNTKISASAKASTMAFEGAETAIAAVFKEGLELDMQSTPGHVLGRAVTVQGEVQRRCVTSTNLFKPADCTAAEFMDQRGLVRSQSRTIMTGQSQILDGGASQVSTTGSGGGAFVYYDFATAAEGSVPVVNVSQFNVQEFTKKGLTIGAISD